MKVYSFRTVNALLKDSVICSLLVEYCEYLANKYNETNEGKYRIKYNDLYPVLFHPLTDEKRHEFFNSFATSLDIFPLQIKKDSIFLYYF